MRLVGSPRPKASAQGRWRAVCAAEGAPSLYETHRPVFARQIADAKPTPITNFACLSELALWREPPTGTPVFRVAEILASNDGILAPFRFLRALSN
jgi:hypothetical protein